MQQPEQSKKNIPPVPAGALLVDWQKVDTILLDMDGTLLDLNFDNHFWKQHLPMRYAEANNTSFEDALNELLPHMMAIRGTLDWYSVYYWSDRLDLDVLALHAEVAHLIQPRPGVADFLALHANSHRRVVLATNAHHDTVDLKFNHAGIEGYFDEVVSSHQLNSPKEHAEFWHRLEQQLDFNPDRCLFIDDNHEVLESAKAFGIGQLLSVCQPDMSQPPQEDNGFPMLAHFNQINPSTKPSPDGIKL